ncbi:MAG: hypothetical protein E7D48_07105 [Bifidobacterium scardovii]|uniref:hypothetical protein n=1 Tax=Bifidobacterium scardovii TaxID=158787 RepID=UPI0029033810|nr:hypothetical protein [Bifidobacterium scardovii]MDU2421850.1 hypothetical protein [Bifidobacterium scardovii]
MESMILLFAVLGFSCIGLLSPFISIAVHAVRLVFSIGLRLMAMVTGSRRNDTGVIGR